MLLLALSIFLGGNAGVVWDRVVGQVAHNAARNLAVKLGPGTLTVDTSDDSSDDDADEPDETAAPDAPRLPGLHVSGKNFNLDVDDSDAERVTITGKNVTTVDALHRIAEAGGWSMTLVGSPREKIDLDIKDQEPRDALRALLKASGSLGVLKGDKLVVVASPEANTQGQLIEQSGSSRRGMRGKHGLKKGIDVVRVFQGDITIEEGQVVQGDVICVGGSVDISRGAVVQGDAVAMGGSVTVQKGALVLGEAIALLGAVDVERGGQVMGDHVNVGVGKILHSSSRPHRPWLTRLGPFGLFPTLALFAIMYLVGLLMLRMWPDRMRTVGHSLFENPVRSFTVGFLSWLLLLPLTLLLAISIVGIPLILLLPLAFFLSIVLGLSSFALRLGESLPAGPGQRFVPPAALGMGMAVLLLVAFVPWLGISILALLQFFALGASVGSRFGRALPPHV
ncbi:MAG TPA: polymer-forming cytoskeletal protein [Myxococcales bacterium]|jgi:uncharacterized membrane protein